MATVPRNMEFTDVASEPNIGPCRIRARCSSSKSTYLQMDSSNSPVRTFKCCTPRTLLQKTHFHESWRDFRVLSFLCVIFLAMLPVTTAQGFLPSYSEYTSTFEWHNPDSLDPEGLNVCVTDRLSPAVDVLPRRKIIKNCETMEVFNPATCRAFRDGFITINDLHVRVNVVDCCDGWLQSRNSCTQRCPPGTYGAGCHLTCQCGGQIQLGCHHVTGECICPTGRTGRVCETTCAVAENAYGPSCALRCPHCRNGGVCNPISGECLCPRDRTGRTCYQRLNCKEPQCPFDCTLCGNDAACDPDLGKCLCNPGWRGRYCTEPCAAGTFGSECSQICMCLNKGVCLPEDGSCVCQTGWIGAHCETACPESYWGNSCEMRCDCPDGRCDPFSGECLCPKGRIGPRCVEECPLDFYGTRCKRKCNCDTYMDCDPVTGRCYQVREIPTTTPLPTTVENIITTVPTTIPTTRMTTKAEVFFTFPAFTLGTTESMVSEKPSRLHTQIVLGTSLGGVLVLAVLLTIAFIWIVFQRRDSTKSAKPIDLKHQNKNNNSEVPTLSDSDSLASGGSDTSNDSSKRILTPPPLGLKPKLPLRRLPQTPECVFKHLQKVSTKLSKKKSAVREPVYECADKVVAVEMDDKFDSLHNYCDPKTSFNNPFYCGKRSPPSVRSVPDSVRRFPPASFSRAATVHSAKNRVKSIFSGGCYEVPECQIELTPTSTRREPAVTGMHSSVINTAGNNGYLELSGDQRETTNHYIGLIK